MRVREQVIDIFKLCWSSFDPEGNGYIDVHKFKEFLILLIEKKCEIMINYLWLKNDDKQIEKFIANLQIPTYLLLL
jgi:hypothetical protein